MKTTLILLLLFDAAYIRISAALAAMEATIGWGDRLDFWSDEEGDILCYDSN